MSNKLVSHDQKHEDRGAILENVECVLPLDSSVCPLGVPGWVMLCPSQY